MFNCNVKLDMSLSQKQGKAFTFVNAVEIMSPDGDVGKWRQLGVPDTHDGKIPPKGKWISMTDGICLMGDNGRDHFAYLKGINLPPKVNDRGSILCPSSLNHNYSGTNIQWQGSGNWTVMGQGANLALQGPITWQQFMAANMRKYGQGMDWTLDSSGGWSVSGGAGGRGGEIMGGYLYLVNPLQNGGKQRVFKYFGGGGGFMMPGFGGTASTKDFPNLGTQLTRGTIATSDPLTDLHELEGMCQIVELSGSWSPIPLGKGSPVGVGGGVSALGIIFGVPTGLALGAFRACGWIAGPCVAAGKTGSGSLGATLSIGHMKLVS